MWKKRKSLAANDKKRKSLAANDKDFSLCSK